MTTSRFPSLSILGLAAALGLAACGTAGGHVHGPTDTVSVQSDGNLDGVVGFDFDTDTALAPNTAVRPGVGDVDGWLGLNNCGHRTVLCFSLDAIPSGALITEAVLRVPQVQVTGTGDPYVDHGTLVVDHVTLGPAGVLEPDHYFDGTLADLGTLATDTSLGMKALDVTRAVQDDLRHGRIRSDFRIRFSLQDTDGDGVSEGVWLNDGEDHDGGAWGVPLLVVTYATEWL